MVRLLLPLAALAMTASVAAAPAPAGVSATTFSFEQWVEDIIAHPDTALTVDEALAAAHAADVVGSAGGLQKRIRCDQESIGWKRAPVCRPPSHPHATRHIMLTSRPVQGRDATACVNDLARKGKNGVTCSIGANVFSIQMCRIGGAQIVGSKSAASKQSANW